MYPLVDVDTPNVFRNLFRYNEIPKTAFNDRIVPHNMPDEIWITDTTFRDGQQSRAPYSTEQIVTIFDYLHRLGGSERKDPAGTPFVGKNFNVTRVGIHADGMLKNEEIYNIFDTEKFLNRPPFVAVSKTSGNAGIAYWINAYYKLPKERQVDKNSELVRKLKEWVDSEYEDGRITVLTDEELVEKIKNVCEELHITL